MRGHLGEDRFVAVLGGRQAHAAPRDDRARPAGDAGRAAGLDAPEGSDRTGDRGAGARRRRAVTDAEVAERLVVSLRTVHAHLRSIYRKLDVHTRSAATRYALEHGLAA